MVTVEPPRCAPKPLPQIVTQTPWFFCPPVLGPLSRSEKKMRGGSMVVRLDGDWARGSMGTTARIIPRTNEDANFMKGFLNTPSAVPLGRTDEKSPTRFRGVMSEGSSIEHG